jgi:hypothetical protein
MSFYELKGISLNVKIKESNIEFSMILQSAVKGYNEICWVFKTNNRACFDSMILEKSIDGVNFFAIGLYHGIKKNRVKTKKIEINDCYIDKVSSSRGTCFYRMRIQFINKMVVITQPCMV